MFAFDPQPHLATFPRRHTIIIRGGTTLKRPALLVTAALLLLMLTPAMAFAHTPWPNNGIVNPITRTYVLEYGQAPYTYPAVENLGGTVVFTLGGSTETITTTARANTVLMTPRYTNAGFRAVLDYKGVDVSGNLQVRHGLSLYKPLKTSTKYTARGKVRPGGTHSVSVALQKQYFGVWITRQKTSVTTNSSGDFSKAFYGRYSGKYRVRAIVASDASNIIQTTYRIY